MLIIDVKVEKVTINPYLKSYFLLVIRYENNKLEILNLWIGYGILTDSCCNRIMRI